MVVEAHSGGFETLEVPTGLQNVNELGFVPELSSVHIYCASLYVDAVVLVPLASVSGPWNVENLASSTDSLIVQAPPQAPLVSSCSINPACSAHPAGNGPAEVTTFEATLVPSKEMESKYIFG